MPLYTCHKKVWALEITNVVGNLLSFAQGEKDVGSAWIEKHNPQVGGYYVTYEDGYTSYSPKEAFEAGYTLVI